jgi:hypothetical protein
MRHIVEAGTDAASLLLFDPGVFPEDFDGRSLDDAVDVLRELTEAGTVRWIDTGGDGGYLLHAYVDEPVPSSLQPYLYDPITVEALPSPTGRLYFTGVEYVFRDDDRQLRKHPHMGGFFAVPPGVCRLTLWRTEYPEGFHEGFRDRLREQVSPWAFRLHQRIMGCLVAIVLFGLVGLAVAAILTPREFWMRWLLPPWVLLLLLPFIVARLRPYREAAKRLREIEREYPSIVALLESSRS